MIDQRRGNWSLLVRLASPVFSLASGTALGQLVVLVATPLLTRLYSPSEFGSFAVFYSITATILVSSSLRYELAIPLPNSSSGASQLMAISLWANVIVSALVFILMVFFGNNLVHVVGSPELGNYVLLVPVVLLCAGSYKAFNYWIIRQQDYRLIGKTKIVQGFASSVAQILAGFSSLGVLGLIIGYLVGQCAGITMLVRGAGATWRVNLRRVFGQNSLRLAKKYHRFPAYDVPAATINALSTHSPAILFAAFFGSAVAGYFMLAQRVLSVPMGLVGQAVGQVLLGGAREVSDDGLLGNQVLVVVAGLSSIIVLPSILVFLFAEGFFGLIFGSAWHEAGLFASWLILGISVQFVYSPISLLLVATDGQHLNLVIHAILLCAKTSAILYGGYVGSAVIAMKVFSIVGGIGYAIGVIIVLAHTKNRTVYS